MPLPNNEFYKILSRMKKLSKKSDRKYPLSGLGLKPDEDKKLVEMLIEHDLSVKQLCRALIRKWMKEGGHTVLEHSKK